MALACDSGDSSKDTGPGKDSADSAAGDTNMPDTGSGGLDEARVSGVSARLHPDFGSLVYVSWEQLAQATGHVEYRFDDEDWLQSPSRALEVGSQEQLLLGIPYDRDVSYRVVNDFGDGELASDVFDIQTDPPPDGVPLATLLSADPKLWEPTLEYLVTCLVKWGGGITAYSIIVDRQGRLLWALEAPSGFVTMYVRPSYDGTAILVDHNSFWGSFDGGDTSQVLRMKLDGTVLATYDTPGLHHSFTELADGSLVWGASDRQDERLDQIDPDGSVHTIWSCQDFYDSQGISGECGSNTVFWDEDADTFLFSFYSTDSIIEIDHATGNTLRWFGQLDRAWQFQPDDSAFWWQHGCSYTGTGTLLVSTHKSEHSDVGVVREYTLDSDTQTLLETWNFGLEDEILAHEMGEAHRLAGGNTLHNYGSTPRVREATPEGEVVWDLEWGNGFYIGRSTPVEDLYSMAP